MAWVFVKDQNDSTELCNVSQQSKFTLFTACVHVWILFVWSPPFSSTAILPTPILHHCVLSLLLNNMLASFPLNWAHALLLLPARIALVYTNLGAHGCPLKASLRLSPNPNFFPELVSSAEQPSTEMGIESFDEFVTSCLGLSLVELVQCVLNSSLPLFSLPYISQSVVKCWGNMGRRSSCWNECCMHDLVWMPIRFGWTDMDADKQAKKCVAPKIR